MEPALPDREESQLQPTEADTAFFDHRFRFTQRGNPVVETLYTLAQQWMLGNGYEMPPPSSEKQTRTVPALDPLDVIQIEVRLPPLPAIMLELQKLLQSNNFSADQVAAVISKDPALTIWLLKLVNSPYYGFSAKVSTISRAVTLVGTRQIQALAIGGALNSLAVLLPKGLLDMEMFWRHSIAVGVTAQELWRLSGQQDSEQLFVSGILHDCGTLALAYAAPQVMSALNQGYCIHSEPAFMLENKQLGFDHARLGGILLHRWNMPLPLVVAALRHHRVEEATRYPEAAAVHVANVVVTALGITTLPSPPVPPLSLDAWNVLGLPPQSLREVIEALREKLDDICAAIKP